MGNLGFLFKGKNENIVVFISSKKFKSNIIVAEKSISKLNNCRLLYLEKDLKLVEFVKYEDTNFRYAKICLSKQSILDYKNLTFWFSAKKYKEIRQLFSETSSNFTFENIIKNTLSLYALFKL